MNNVFEEFLLEANNLKAELLDSAKISHTVKQQILEYPEISTLVDFIKKRKDKKAVKIDPVMLSKNGEVKSDPMQEYLESKNIPSSGFKEVLKNPANFYYYLNDRSIVYEDPKAHFELGTFCHMAFLEPEMFENIVECPKVNLTTLEGHRELINFYYKLNGETDNNLFGYKMDMLKNILIEQKNLCKSILIQKEHKTVIDIIRKQYDLYGNGIIKKIMHGALVETSFYGVDEATGLKVKVRPDAINIAENIGVNAIISFKTTSQESIEGFYRDSAKYQYELSEGMYQEVISNVTGRKFDVTIMVMLQTVAPFLPAVFWWSPEDLQNGKYKYRIALDTAKECIEKNKYPGFESLSESGNYGIINMHQPTWAHKILSPVEIDI